MFCIIDYSWIFNDTDYLFATSETLSVYKCSSELVSFFFSEGYNMFH